MANGAKGQEILRSVFAPLCMFLKMVKLQMSRIGRIPKSMRPPTIAAAIAVTHQYLAPNVVGNMAIVLRRLSIFLQNVYADRQIWAAAGFGNDRPTEF